MQRLRLPIPLGGTTVYFRRDLLEAVGGWDAHNVTEDADLGMRLSRFGYRTEVMPHPFLCCGLYGSALSGLILKDIWGERI